MDFNLERSQAHAIKNMDFSNDSREELESMAEELYEKYDEIKKFKKQIEKLKQENEKLKKQENNVVNKDIRWGLVGTKINYSWLWTTMTERYGGDDEYDFEQDITNSENDNSMSEKEYIICRDLSNQIEKHINCGQGEKIEDDVNDAISEIAELYKKCCPRCIEEYEDEKGNWCKGERKESCCSGCGVCEDCECLHECEELVECGVLYDKEKEKIDKVNRDLDQIGRWVRKSNENYDDWSYDDEKEKLEIYVGDHTERYTRQELVECGVLYD